MGDDERGDTRHDAGGAGVTTLRSDVGYGPFGKRTTVPRKMFGKLGDRPPVSGKACRCLSQGG